MEILLNPPFTDGAFIELFFKLSFTTAAESNSIWALPLLIFSLHNLIISLQCSWVACPFSQAHKLLFLCTKFQPMVSVQPGQSSSTLAHLSAHGASLLLYLKISFLRKAQLSQTTLSFRTSSWTKLNQAPNRTKSALELQDGSSGDSCSLFLLESKN